MANQEQNPPQQKQPFLAAKQVSFNLEDIILNTNNEVALLNPEHTNHDFFKCVLDFISKCCLREPFTRSLNMYKEYLVEFWYSAKTLENSKVSFFVPTGGIYGEVGVNTFRNAIGAHYLPHSIKYVAPPSIDIVRPWFETIGKKVVSYTRFLSLLMMHKMKEGYGDGEVTTYPTQVFSINNWALKPNQPEEPLFTYHMLAICNEAEPVAFKAPKPSSNAERVPQAEADLGKSALSDFVPQQQGMNEGTKNTSYDHLFAGTDPHVEEDEASRTIKLEDLAKLVSSVQPSFKDPDSPEDNPIIVVDDSDEDEANEVHATTNVETEDTSSQKHKLELEKNKDEVEATLLKAQPSFPNVGQLNELLSKLKTLDALPSQLNKVINALNRFAQAITSKKTGDTSVPSACQAGTQPAKGKKNTNQATTS
nr:hypothetical protein [Tanacetum cinerariifolium]